MKAKVSKGILAGAVVALAGLLGFASLALSQTQAVLPNGMTQFRDGNGAPYAGGHVYMYVPHTTTPKATYQDPYGASPNANPITLDANGRGVIWGSGVYRQVLQDAFGGVVWDQLSYASPASAGASGGVLWYGTAIGTANAITLTGPTGFNATDGQEVGFVASATNTSSVTINAGGYGSVLVEKNTSVGPTVLTGGEITAGNLTYATYSASAAAFILQGVTPVAPGAGSLGFVGSGVAGTANAITVATAGPGTWANQLGYEITFIPTYTNTGATTLQVGAGAAVAVTKATTGGVAALQGGEIVTGQLTSATFDGTEFVLTSPAAAPVPVQVNGRLTLTSATPALTGAVTSSAIYWTPYHGATVPLWNGNTFVNTTFSEVSQALADTTHSPAAAVAGGIYDEFVCNIAGVTSLSRGAVWSSATVRGPSASGLSNVSGVLVNTTAITNGCAAGYGTYVGTVATDLSAVTTTFNPGPAATGGGPSGGAWVGLWNNYNRIPIGAHEQDSAGGVYGTPTWRVVNGQTANNRITFVTGQAEDGTFASYSGSAYTSTGSVYGVFGLAMDSTTSPAAQLWFQLAAGYGSYTAEYTFLPMLGQHVLYPLEYATGSFTTNVAGSMMFVANLRY